MPYTINREFIKATTTAMTMTMPENNDLIAGMRSNNPACTHLSRSL